MASKDPPPSDRLGKELSSFFKAAVSAFEDVSEQVVQSGRAGKATIDVQVLKRQREKALVRLGELVLTHLDTGGTAPPGGDVVVTEIAGLDAQLKQAQQEADKLFTIGDPLAGFGKKADGAAKTEPPQPAKAEKPEASDQGDHPGDRKKPS